MQSGHQTRRRTLPLPVADCRCTCQGSSNNQHLSKHELHDLRNLRLCSVQ
jgi:hypothetical protein